MGLTYSSLTAFSIAVVAVAALALLKSLFRRRLLKDIQGPPSNSFWLGHEKDLRYQNEVGDLDFQWMAQYGTAWRVDGCMGEDILMLVDPKALQHILQAAGYKYPKSAEDRQFLRMVTGEGLAWAHGEDHSRQRKIMNPAFSSTQLKTFLPLFHFRASQLVQKWESLIAGDVSNAPVLNVASWLSRMTLDVIGEAGFGFEFGALDDTKSEFMNNWDSLFIDSTLYPAPLDLLAKSFFNSIPTSVLYYTRYLPSREYRRFREYLDFARVISQDIIRKSEARGDGKDVMSVLVRANASENPKTKLSEPEVIDQISTLMLAGHDTTAATASWVLWELAKDPEFQRKVREEIRAARAQVTARGDADFSMADLEGLTLMQAAMKVRRRVGRGDFPILKTCHET